MEIKKAEVSDLDIVIYITGKTISAVYPGYYPKGAVDFFLCHHCADNIAADIDSECVWLGSDNGHAVGTVTIKANRICRLFVLPEFQGNGFGRELLGFAEKFIFEKYSEIVLDASLPAKAIYLKRGYKEIEYHTIKTGNGEFLCYDVMKRLKPR